MGDQKVEDIVSSILSKVKRAHDKHGKPPSPSISSMILAIYQELFDTTSATIVHEKVELFATQP